MSLIKYTHFGRFNLELRCEAFNILNHPQFAGPNGQIGNANVGCITAMLSNPPAPSAARPSATSSSRSCRSDSLNRFPRRRRSRRPGHSELPCPMGEKEAAGDFVRPCATGTLSPHLRSMAPDPSACHLDARLQPEPRRTVSTPRVRQPVEGVSSTTYHSGHSLRRT
jgi:hypothetical protein